MILKKGREESLQRFHPWIFSGAVASIEGEPFEGEAVAVLTHHGEFIAVGHYQKGSIAVRVLSFSSQDLPMPGGEMPAAFWQRKITDAMRLRTLLSLPSPQTDCYRLVHGEGDALPGLVVDVYGRVAVLQAHSAGMYLAAEAIGQALMTCSEGRIEAVYNKSGATAPHKAGLKLQDGYLQCSAQLPGEAVVMENGCRFHVDWVTGQKTGFFLDQRDNRSLLGSYSRDRAILNLFCYTGGFSIYALASGARRVVSVDSSARAVQMLERNAVLNLGAEDAEARHEAVCSDAIEYLRDVKAGEFDVLVVDPPAFAKHQDAVDNALRAYRRLNFMAISKVAHGGLVFTYSCSQAVNRKNFELAVFSAAAKARRNVRILRRLTQPADHPVSIFHPEGDYLKGLLLYVE